MDTKSPKDQRRIRWRGFFLGLGGVLALAGVGATPPELGAEDRLDEKSRILKKANQRLVKELGRLNIHPKEVSGFFGGHFMYASTEWDRTFTQPVWERKKKPGSGGSRVPSPYPSRTKFVWVQSGTGEITTNPVPIHIRYRSNEFSLAHHKALAEDIHRSSGGSHSLRINQIVDGQSVSKTVSYNVPFPLAKNKVYEGLPGGMVITKQVGQTSRLTGLRDLGRAGYAGYFGEAKEVDRVYQIFAFLNFKKPPDWSFGVEAFFVADRSSLISEIPVPNEAVMDQVMTAIARVLNEAIQGSAPPLQAFDLNPLFNEGKSFREWCPREAETCNALATEITQKRKGTVADGASELLLRLRFAEEGRAEFEVAGEGNGTIQAVKNGKTHARGKRHYGFARYTPPSVFGRRGREEKRLKDQVAARTVKIRVRFRSREGDRQEHDYALVLARPPVVLVHGTYSTPQKWTDRALVGDRSMRQALRRNGFLPFLVDYRQTNGDRTGGSSHFKDNAMVVWDDRLHGPEDAPDGGIQAALRFYREELDLAATQADVVGHSLGGLLPRVYASAAYTGGEARYPDQPSEGYFRPDNFGKGDIHRLITLCTPHHGSDLPRLLRDLGKLNIEGWSPQAWKAWWEKQKLYRIGSWMAGIHTGAAADQIPQSGPLQQIGSTPVPAHAVGCTARLMDLYKPLFPEEDPRNREMRNLYLQLAYSFFKRPGLLEVFRERDELCLKAVGDGSGKKKLVGNTERLKEVVDLLDWTLWERIDSDRASRSSSFLKPSVPGRSYVGERQLLQLLRAAVFGNTPNDTVVRLASQAGGLEEPYFTRLNGILHGQAPMYRAVQRRVIGLLSGPDKPFSPEGFPEAGRPVIDRPPGLFRQPAADRRQAIERSHIVPAHADAIARLVYEENILLFVRPVNEHATALIADGAATKNMHVKGKSSDWGPHQGLIAVDQGFSKLANGKDRKKIPRFNCAVMDSLKKGVAKRKPFVTRLEGKQYQVRKLREKVSGRDKPFVVLRDRSGGYRTWSGRRPPVPLTDETTVPLEVLTDSDRPLYLTADYDLLAIGRAKPPQPIPDPFDPDMGNISEEQKELIRKINQAVEETGYTGGKVVHHGPENQFTQSPGVDYPETVFEPGPSSGWILIIDEGPEGKKDLYLKRYFHQKKMCGWYLKPNEKRWGWGPYDPVRGYREEDAPPARKEEKMEPQCAPLPPCGSPKQGGTLGCWDAAALSH